MGEKKKKSAEELMELLLEKFDAVDERLKKVEAAPPAAAARPLAKHRVSPEHTRYSDNPEAFVLDLAKRLDAVEESLGLEPDEDAGDVVAPSDAPAAAAEA